MNPLSIVISEPGSYFSVFYQLAFMLPFILLLVIGIRRKYNMLSWLVILLSSAFFFLLGTRIITFTAAEWKELLLSGNFPVTYKKFALGGLILALPLIELVRRFLKFRQPVLSLFACVVPIGLAVQKVGCLVSGCCYGTPTTLPWGIKYSEGMQAYLDHLNSGLINESAMLSHAVHPTQIYQIITYLLITFLVFRGIRKNWSEAPLVLLALSLVLISRFTLEFFIDKDATTFGASVFMGLKLIQWLCLISGIFFSIVLLKTGVKNRSDNIYRRENLSLARPIVVLAAISLLFILLHQAFSSLEIIAFNIRFLLITSILAVLVFFRITIPRFRIASILLFLLPILLLSQTVEKTPYEKNKSLSFGSSFGHYVNEIRYNPHESCTGGTAYDRADYNSSKFSLQAEYTYSGMYGFKNYRYGSYLTAGYLNELNLETDSGRKLGLVYASPFAEINERWFGAGGQLHLCYIPYIRVFPLNESTPPDNNHRFSPVLPGAMLRFGPYDIAYLRLDYNYISTAGFPLNSSTFSVGTGLGSKRSAGIRAGLSLENPETYFFEGDFWFSDDFGVWANYMHTSTYSSGIINSNLFSIGVRSRLKN